MADPAVVIIVVLDEPSGSYYGGTVAAPVFREIAERVLPYLDVMPDTELKPEDRRGGEELIARAKSNGEAQAASGEGAGSEKSPVEGVAPATLPESVRREGEIREVVYAAAAERALVMPDVRGRSVRDAARICAQLGLEFEARGEGRVVGQTPAAGAAVEVGQRVRAEFARGD